MKYHEQYRYFGRDKGQTASRAWLGPFLRPMTLRAIITEPSGDQDILAYRATEEEWIGVNEAYEASRTKGKILLRLPCCGGLAVPKSGSRRAKHFAHRQGDRNRCSQAGRLANELRHALIVHLETALVEAGWSVTIEAKVGDYSVDMLCTLPERQFQIGLEFETGGRTNEQLEALAAGLSSEGLDFIHWFFKKGRRGSLPNIRRTETLISGNAEEAAPPICRMMANIKERVEEFDQIVSNAKMIGMTVETVGQDGFPTDAQFESDGHTFSVRISEDKIEISGPGEGLRSDTDNRQDSAAKAQESLIAAVRRALSEGRPVYWDGYPELYRDSFARLRADIRRREEQQSRPGGRTPEHGNTLLRDPGDQPWEQDETEETPKIERSACLAQELRPSTFDEEKIKWANMRIRDAKLLLQRHYGEAYSEDILDTPLQGGRWDGWTPKQICIETSQSLEALEIHFGYRDPWTKSPIRK